MNKLALTFMVLSIVCLSFVGCNSSSATPEEYKLSIEPQGDSAQVIKGEEEAFDIKVSPPTFNKEQAGIEIDVSHDEELECDLSITDRWTLKCRGVEEGSGVVAVVVIGPDEGVIARGTLTINVAAPIAEADIPTSTPTEASTTDTPMPTDTPSPTEEPTGAPIKTPTKGPTAAISIEEPDIEVACPENAACIFNIKGTTTGIAADSSYKIVPFVNPGPGNPNSWYPQPDQPLGSQINEDGTWNAEAQIGTENGVGPGHRFEIVALVMDSTAQIRVEFQRLPESVARSNVVELNTTQAGECPFARPVRPKISGTTDYSGELTIAAPEDCTADLPTGPSTAMGTYSEDLEGREIWILAYASDRKYYPQSSNACETLPATAAEGRWEAGLFFGGAGERLDIVATVTDVDSEASQEFKNWLKTGCDTGEFPGFSNLPDGLMELDFASVQTEEPAEEPTTEPTEAPAEEPTPESVACPIDKSLRPPIQGPPVDVEVAITSPGHCATGLSTPVTVGGTYSGDLTANEIWVLVYPTDSRYYPQSVNACAQIPSEVAAGIWRTTAHFGGPPQKYDVVVVVTETDGEASREFKRWLKEGCDTGNFLGYLRDALPTGISEVVSITVSTELPTSSETTNPSPTPKPARSVPVTGPQPVYMGSALAPDYDMGVATSGGLTDWVTDMGGFMCMAYPDDQDWGAVFITVGQPTAPPRPSQDLSGYQALSLELRGEGGGESVWVGLKDSTDPDDGTETKQQVSNLTQDWRTFTFPLSSFSTADPARLNVVTEFVFEPGTPAETVCFRNIQYLP